MAHGNIFKVDFEAALDAKPLKASPGFRALLWAMAIVGATIFSVELLTAEESRRSVIWGCFYINLVFWMGLSVGGVILTLIFQIVRATWSPSIRRLAEANVAFFPIVYLMFLFSYFGRWYLFPWARAPMPGREYWMQPDFVYGRFAILLGILFLALSCFVRRSLRGDIGLLREKRKDAWTGQIYQQLTRNWAGSEKEIPELQRLMSVRAPLLIAVYVTIYSLFVFEMVMGTDTIWYSNLYGAFSFVGNVFLGWASLALLIVAYDHFRPEFGKFVSANQLWDLGKLMFGFTMLWGYMFFSQFLPQWYGNLPEETAWLILRTREYPWKPFAYTVFAMCFVVPFVTLLSRDLKRTPYALATVAMVILLGVWGEKYVTLMPTYSPSSIPLLHGSWGEFLLEVSLLLGFAGAYLLCITSFLAKYPFLPISSPLIRGDTEW